MLVEAIGDRSVQLGIWLMCLPGLLFGTLNVLAPLRMDALGTGGVHRHVGTGGELPQPLAAAATRRHRLGPAVGHGQHGDDDPLAGGDHRPDGRGLGARTLGERGVLGVGAGEHPPGISANRGADREAGVRRVGVGPGHRGGLEQFLDLVGRTHARECTTSPHPRVGG